MKKIILDKKRVWQILGVLFVLSVFILIVFVYAPLIVKVNSMRGECEYIEQEISAVRDLIAANNNMERKMKLLGPDNASLAIKEMTDIGTSLNIKFTAISLQKKEKVENGGYELQPIAIELEARYKDLGVFLDTVKIYEESIITVREFDILRDVGIAPLVKARLVLDLYLKESVSE